MNSEELLAMMQDSPELFNITKEELVVNPVTRTINVPVTEELFGVFQDSNVERKYFRCPKIVGDNVDLSKCKIFINYVSASGKLGMYECQDVTTEDDNIKFSWVLSSNVFDEKLGGEVYFAMQALKIDDSGRSLSVFNTTKAVGKTLESVEGSKAIAEQEADIILQLISRMDRIEDAGFGGYYIPKISMVDDSMVFNFDASKPGMPNVEKTVVKLPNGANGTIVLNGPPTPDTVGKIGQLAYDQDNNVMYKCRIKTSSGKYSWDPVFDGGTLNNPLRMAKGSQIFFEDGGGKTTFFVRAYREKMFLGGATPGSLIVVTGVDDPNEPSDAANKNYVDSQISQMKTSLEKIISGMKA